MPAARAGSPASIKRAKLDDTSVAASPSSASSSTAVAAAAASSSSSVAPDSTGLLSFTGGVNPRLHVSLSDTATDDRFPALAASHASHFLPDDARTLLQLFLAHVLPECSDVSITLERLMALVYVPHVRRFRSMSREQSVSCLLHAGVLVFKTATSFYFSAPNVARLLTALRSGRKEVVALIRKRAYKEIPLRDLLALPKLKSSPCRVDFHLREMLGSEQLIQCVDTTMGPLIKLASADK